jgi:hypothetical protein
LWLVDNLNTLRETTVGERKIAEAVIERWR